jgi:methylmalonyl-CoA mutase C-terminal domain/subunit
MSPTKPVHPPKVLVTKIGLDGHDRGSRVVAAFLRDAGMEVLYTPPWQEIGQVVRLAEEEDVDVIGISSLATDHLLVPKLLKALAKAGLADVPVVIGGIVPDEDERKLRKAGVREICLQPPRGCCSLPATPSPAASRSRSALGGTLPGGAPCARELRAPDTQDKRSR